MGEAPEQSGRDWNTFEDVETIKVDEDRSLSN